MQKIKETQPFLRIHRIISISSDFRIIKVQDFYWLEMQNLILFVREGPQISPCSQHILCHHPTSSIEQILL